MTLQAFILGGGQVGRRVAHRLLDDGYDVTLLTRGRSPLPDDLLARGAAQTTGDREVSGTLARTLGAGADLLVDTLAYDEGHARQLLDVQEDLGALAVISTASVYCDDQGRTLTEALQNGVPDYPERITEEQPTVAPGPETYSTRKAALERHLVDHATIPVLLARPSSIHGAGSTHPREWWLVKRMLDDRPVIPLIEEGAVRFHTSAAANIAELIAAWTASPHTAAVNIGDPDAPSVREIAELIAAHLGYRGTILPLPATGAYRPGSLGWTPSSVATDFVLDTTRATALGYRPATSYAEAVGPLIDWLAAQPLEGWEPGFPVLAGYPLPLFDYAAEDAELRRRGLID